MTANPFPTPAPCKKRDFTSAAKLAPQHRSTGRPSSSSARRRSFHGSNRLAVLAPVLHQLGRHWEPGGLLHPPTRALPCRTALEFDREEPSPPPGCSAAWCSFSSACSWSPRWLVCSG